MNLEQVDRHHPPHASIIYIYICIVDTPLPLRRLRSYNYRHPFHRALPYTYISSSFAASLRCQAKLPTVGICRAVREDRALLEALRQPGAPLGRSKEVWLSGPCPGVGGLLKLPLPMGQSKLLESLALSFWGLSCSFGS